MPVYRLPDGSDDTPDANGRHTKTVNVLHSAEQAQRFPGCDQCRSIAAHEDPGYQAAVAAYTAGITPVLDRVEITESPAEPGEWGMPAHFTVRPFWSGVDRPNTGGITVKINNRPLAERLARAIRAGVAVEAESVGVDTAGQTYVVERTHVLGRMLNADLRRLGF